MFEYRQAEELRDAFAGFGVRYLFIGKSGANRQKDRESIERLEDFRAYLRSKGL